MRHRVYQGERIADIKRESIYQIITYQLLKIILIQKGMLLLMRMILEIQKLLHYLLFLLMWMQLLIPTSEGL